MAKALSKADKARFEEIRKATLAGGSVFATVAAMAKLHDAGLVEGNPGIVNPAKADEIAFRVKAEHLNAPAGPTPPATPAEKPVFVIEDNVPLPEPKRGAVAREPIYPFASLNVGQSFFIPASEAVPEPAKKFASTVSTASKRFSKEVPDPAKPGETIRVYERKFVIRAVEGGARVWRVAVEA